MWALAAIGVVTKSIRNIGSGRLSVILYLAMGWLGVLAAKPLMDNLPVGGLAWLLAGGLMYSIGVLFFVLDHRVKYSHFVWHLFVLAGTGCHVVSVMQYAL
ncbi:MAG: hemolysin III family protein [Cyclobacteriaceae bacterium]|nr:hemolysin III family protein [Cyclobacteriaceae bacterium]MCB0498477.1 hemolysin III family protein [Cyclobacteriaceae bacterium]MCW5901337.1 hemolysin III family protein [Cyclobacteriaceae bacterium]